MHKKNFLKKSLVLVIIILFFGAGVAPCINGTISKMSGSELNKKTLNQELLSTEQISNSLLATGDENSSSLVFHTFDETGEKQQNVVLPKDDADKIIDILEELKYKIVYEPKSEETQALKNEFVDLLDAYGLIPAGLSKEDVLSMLNPSWLNNKQKTTEVRTRTLLLRSFTSRITEKIVNLQQIFKNRFGITVLKNFDKNTMITPSYADTATATFCSISSGGNGITLPLFLLPRPRGVAVWSASLAVTLVGELLTGKGFIAGGAQSGTALGFIGLGLTYAFPGYTMYGFVGYALYTRVNAESIEFFEPPNQAPIISDENPPNGGKDVSVTLPELSFRINDPDGDQMDYTVTTEPDIGSGSGNNKNNGVYKVPISGLNENTEYTWHVIVDDEYNTVEKEFTFTTEAVAPIVSNPYPPNDARNIPLDLSQLTFTLKDFQGDSMDYTVETSPDIGSGSGTGVGDGTYTVDISGLDYSIDYTWYVSVTDGTYTTNEVYSFKTRPIPGSWWGTDWAHRKEIIVDYSKVEGSFSNFPVLISLESDDDLAVSAQDDGDDIVFTNYNGVKLNHEIEYFDDSSGELVAWVNVPSFTPDTILYMYYGNSNCNNQQNVAGTWNSNYVGVYHMDESSGTLTDSAKQHNMARHNSPAITAGVIGNALDFEADDSDYFEVTHSDFNFEGKSNFTIECWASQETFRDASFNPRVLVGLWNPRQYLLMAYDTNNFAFNVYDTASNHLNGITDKVTGQWYYVTAISNNTNHCIYVNGTLEGTDTHNDVASSSAPFRIGGVGATEFADGIIDEVRVSNIVRNPDWIKTSYNTMNAPSSFFSVGPEESGP